MRKYSVLLSFSISSIAASLCFLSCIQGPSNNVCIPDERMTGEKPKIQMISSQWTLTAASKDDLIEDMTNDEYRIELFDRNGRSMASSWYKPTEEVLFKYDEHGNILELGVTIHGNTDTRFAFAYDDLSNFKQSTEYMGGLHLIATFHYDNNSNLAQIVHSDNKTSYKGNIVFEYDVQGRMVEEIQIDDTQATVTKRTYEYYDDGKLKEKQHYTYCGSEVEDSQHDGFQLNSYDKYDNFGNKIENVYYACCCCGCCNPSANDLKTHISTYDYVSCDEYGNWTKYYEYTQIIDVSGDILEESVRGQSRSITYYQ